MSKLNEPGAAVDGGGRGGKATWHWKVLFNVYGPAAVDNALHGASQEARELWKRDWAERKRVSAEMKRARQERRRQPGLS